MGAGYRASLIGFSDGWTTSDAAGSPGDLTSPTDEPLCFPPPPPPPSWSSSHDNGENVAPTSGHRGLKVSTCNSSPAATREEGFFLLLPPGGEGSTLDELEPGWNLEPRRRASEAKGDSGSQGQKGNFRKAETCRLEIRFPPPLPISHPHHDV